MKDTAVVTTYDTGVIITPTSDTATPTLTLVPVSARAYLAGLAKVPQAHRGMLFTSLVLMSCGAVAMALLLWSPLGFTRSPALHPAYDYSATGMISGAGLLLLTVYAIQYARRIAALDALSRVHRPLGPLPLSDREREDDFPFSWGDRLHDADEVIAEVSRSLTPKVRANLLSLHAEGFDDAVLLGALRLGDSAYKKVTRGAPNWVDAIAKNGAARRRQWRRQWRHANRQARRAVGA